MEETWGMLTGQTPPEMMRSNDRASGIPWDMPLLPEVIDSLMDFCFSAPESESRDEALATREGRR